MFCSHKKKIGLYVVVEKKKTNHLSLTTKLKKKPIKSSFFPGKIKILVLIFFSLMEEKTK